MEHADQVVTQFGTPLDKQQFAMLRREFERTGSKGDEKAFQRVCEEIDGLRWRVLYRHDWFWREIFDSFRQPGVPFIDACGSTAPHSPRAKPRSLRETATDCERWSAPFGNFNPKGDAEATRERAVRSGLRKF